MVGSSQHSASQSMIYSTTTPPKSQKGDRCQHTEKRFKRLPINPHVTFFEIVNPPHQLSRSYSANSQVVNRKPKIIAIIEESSSTSTHGSFQSWSISHELDHDDQSFSSSNSSFTSFTSNDSFTLSSQTEVENLDELDGSLLPDFFTYTSAEREFIRQYQPVIFPAQRKSLSLGESTETSCFWAM